MDVWPACMSVWHMCALCLWTDDDTGFAENRVKKGYELPCS